MLYAFDIETTGLRVHEPGVHMFAWAVAMADERYVIRREGEAGYKSYLQKILADPASEIICHNLKFELSFLRKHGYNLHPKITWHDTMILSQLYNNIAPSHGLDALAETWFDYPTDVDKEVAGIAKALDNRYDKVPENLMREYQRRDVERTMILFQMLYPHIKESQALHADYRNEIALIFVTEKMERRGVRLLRDNAQELITDLLEKQNAVDKRLVELEGVHYNLSSMKDVNRLLFEVHRFKHPFIGTQRTDKDVITEMKRAYPTEEIFDLILAHRSWKKGIGITQGYLSLTGTDDIVHPNIKTNHARSGRQATDSPNLQNVSKAAVQGNPYTVHSRKCFGPRIGYCWLLVDYAGIEIRLVAERTGEPEMLEIIKRNGDLHSLAGELFYGDKWDKSRTMRGPAKNTQFAVAYGAGLASVADSLHIAISEAKPGLDRYRARFPRVAAFTSNTAKQIKEYGYITTPFGRKLFINPEKAYSGSNYDIQGTAAGIMKRGEVQAQKYIDGCGIDAHIVLTVHDELMIEYPLTELRRVHEFCNGVRAAMITMPKIGVPLEVEWKITKTNWNEATGLKVRRPCRLTKSAE